MEVRLEKYVDGQWFAYGVYDISTKDGLRAYTEACAFNGRYFEPRHIRGVIVKGDLT